MKCASCGHSITHGVKYCAECGEKVEVVTQQPVNGAKIESSTMNGSQAGAIIAVVVIVGLIAIGSTLSHRREARQRADMAPITAVSSETATAAESHASLAEHYTAAEDAYRSGDYQTAVDESELALEVQPTHKESKALYGMAHDKLAVQKAQQQKAHMAQLWASARASVTTDISSARSSLEEMYATDPSYPGLTRALSRLKWHALCYYEGGAIVQISIPYVHQVGSRVELFVWAMNSGSAVLSVNPNDITIEDTNNSTYAHSTETYSYANYFDAVDLQPGTKSGGMVVFENVSGKLSKVNYANFLDTVVTRDIPSFNGDIDLNTHDLSVF